MESYIYYVIKDGEVKYLFNWRKCGKCDFLVSPKKTFCCPKCRDGKGHAETSHYRFKDERVKVWRQSNLL